MLPSLYSLSRDNGKTVVDVRRMSKFRETEYKMVAPMHYLSRSVKHMRRKSRTTATLRWLANVAGEKAPGNTTGNFGDYTCSF